MSALVLHLELDGFDVIGKNEVVRDVSGHDNNGTLVGDVDLVADDTFGACASFDGKSKHHIAVPSTAALKITGDVTLEAWVYVRGERTGWVRVVGKGIKTSSRSYGLWYQANATSTTWLFQRAAGTVFDNCQFTVTHPQSPFNTWYHLTGVVSGKKASLYLHDAQGRLIRPPLEENTTLSGSQLDNDAPFTVGCAPDLLLPHAGRIAHVRLHEGARSQAEIESDIGRDRLALAPFRKSHPMDFRVYDDDDQAVLCISDDPAGHNLHLELRNTSTHALEWNNGHGGKASDSNHHVAVRFRPGALSDSVLKTLVDPDPVTRATILSAPDREEWDVYFPPRKPAANEASSLYLLYTGKKPTFQPNESRTLTFQKMSAAPGSGTRGTLVEFLPAQLTYTGDDKTLITGARTQYVHITNQLGRKNIPLHVWLTKGNHVLNNGEKGPDLTLRISNGSTARDLILEKGVSKFLISFDVGDDDWALTDKTGAKDVEAWHGKEPLTVVSPAVENVTTKEWEWKFSDKTVLAKRGESGKPLEVEIKNITTRSSGHANLYVRYEGIPGYQDGQFILTVVKSPLVYGKDGAVGVGTPAPKAPLHVNGSLRIDGSRTVVNGFDDGGDHWIKTSPKEDKALFMAFVGAPDGAAQAVRISPGGPGGGGLVVKKFEDHRIRVGIGTDVALNSSRASTLTINKAITHDAQFNYSTAPLTIFLPIEKHNGGNTPNPTEDILHLAREGVNGVAFGNKVSLAIGRYKHDSLNSCTQLDIKLTDGYFNQHKPVLSLQSNGHVGIGTPDPKAPLHVNGILRIDGGRTVINGFDGGKNHWIKTNGKEEGKSVFMAFIGDADGEAKSVQISPGGASGGGLFVGKNGCVGIGDAEVLKQAPGNPKLEVVGSQKGNVHSVADGTTLGSFYSKDRIQGIGISSNRIAAIGETGRAGWPDQHLYLAPKGDGSLMVEGHVLIGPDDPKTTKDKKDLQLSGVLRGPRNQPAMISCPHITDKKDARQVLTGQTNVVVFWHNGGDLNWGFMDDKGDFKASWVRST